MHMNRSSLFAAVVAGLGLAASAGAATIFSDTFSYPNGALLPVPPATGPAVNGGWVATGTANATNPIQVTGGVAVMLTSGQDGNSPFSSNFAHADGDKLVTSLDVNVSAAQASGDYFTHLGNTGDSSLFFQRLFVKSSGAGYVLGIIGSSVPSGGAPVYGGAVLGFGTSTHIDVTWNVLAGALNDTFDIAVNGSPYVTGAAWTSTTGEPAGSLSTVNLRQGSGTAAATLTVDNININYTPAVVPEPMALGLIAPAALMIARRRRA